MMKNRYLDQLGMAAKYDTKTYCRQTLIGGNYGLLNTTTFVPNPDYYRLHYISFLFVPLYCLCLYYQIEPEILKSHEIIVRKMCFKLEN